MEVNQTERVADEVEEVAMAVSARPFHAAGRTFFLGLGFTHLTSAEEELEALSARAHHSVASMCHTSPKSLFDAVEKQNIRTGLLTAG